MGVTGGGHLREKIGMHSFWQKTPVGTVSPRLKGEGKKEAIFGLHSCWQKTPVGTVSPRVKEEGEKDGPTTTTCLADKTNHPVERLSLNRSQ